MEDIPAREVPASPNINSVLKAPKVRIPLKDLCPPAYEEDNTAARKRRVSFANVNKIKEFSSGAESMVVCHTPAYEEPFSSISSDSSCPSGAEGWAPAKNAIDVQSAVPCVQKENQLGQPLYVPASEMLHYIHDYENVSTIPGLGRMSVTSCEGRRSIRNSDRFSIEMDLTEGIRAPLDDFHQIMDLTKGAPGRLSNQTVLDDLDEIDLTDAIVDPRLSTTSTRYSINPLRTSLGIEYSVNNTRYSCNAMDLTKAAFSHPSPLGRRSTQYSLNDMELTEPVDNNCSVLEFTEVISDPKILSTRYSLNDIDFTDAVIEGARASFTPEAETDCSLTPNTKKPIFSLHKTPRHVEPLKRSWCFSNLPGGEDSENGSDAKQTSQTYNGIQTPQADIEIGDTETSSGSEASNVIKEPFCHTQGTLYKRLKTQGKYLEKDLPLKNSDQHLRVQSSMVSVSHNSITLQSEFLMRGNEELSAGLLQTNSCKNENLSFSKTTLINSGDKDLNNMSFEMCHKNPCINNEHVVLDNETNSMKTELITSLVNETTYGKELTIDEPKCIVNTEDVFNKEELLETEHITLINETDSLKELTIDEPKRIVDTKDLLLKEELLETGHITSGSEPNSMKQLAIDETKSIVSTEDFLHKEELLETEHITLVSEINSMKELTLDERELTIDTEDVLHEDKLLETEHITLVNDTSMETCEPLVLTYVPVCPKSVNPIKGSFKIQPQNEILKNVGIFDDGTENQNTSGRVVFNLDDVSHKSKSQYFVTKACPVNQSILNEADEHFSKSEDYIETESIVDPSPCRTPCGKNITMSRGISSRFNFESSNLMFEISDDGLRNKAPDQSELESSLPLIQRLVSQQDINTPNQMKPTAENTLSGKGKGRKRSFEVALEHENDTPESPVKQISLASTIHVLDSELFKGVCSPITPVNKSIIQHESETIERSLSENNQSTNTSSNCVNNSLHMPLNNLSHSGDSSNQHKSLQEEQMTESDYVNDKQNESVSHISTLQCRDNKQNGAHQVFTRIESFEEKQNKIIQKPFDNFCKDLQQIEHREANDFKIVSLTPQHISTSEKQILHLEDNLQNSLSIKIKGNEWCIEDDSRDCSLKTKNMVNNKVISLRTTNPKSRQIIEATMRPLGGDVFLCKWIIGWIDLKFTVKPNGSLSNFSPLLVCSEREKTIGDYLAHQVMSYGLPTNRNRLVCDKSLTLLANQLSHICKYLGGSLQGHVLTLEVINLTEKFWAFIDVNIKYPKDLRAEDIHISEQRIGQLKLSRVREIFCNMAAPDRLLNFATEIKSLEYS